MFGITLQGKQNEVLALPANKQSLKNFFDKASKV